VPQSKKLDSIADQNMNESNTSTSNLSSAASFDGESVDQMTPDQGISSEQPISAAAMQKKYKSSQNSLNSASQKSLENIDLKNETTSRIRKGSLGDLTNNLVNYMNRRSSNVETLSSGPIKQGEENENDVEMEFEHVDLNSKKNE